MPAGIYEILNRIGIIYRTAMDFYSDYKDLTFGQCPAARPLFQEDLWKQTVFPETVPVPLSALSQVKRVVQTLYSLTKESFYLNFLNSQKPPEIVDLYHPQDSVLMAYDFHIDSSGAPRLIEVNTNAGGFLIANKIRQVHGMEHQEALESLKRSFQEEWRAFQKTKQPPRRTVLVDERPEQQKMFMEFLFFKDFFHSMGWPADIQDSSRLKESSPGCLIDENGRVLDFIYNRSTDFYFENSLPLFRAYKGKKACFSPHPSNYFLLADKVRLCQWLSHSPIRDFLKDIERNLVESRILTEKNSATAWENRKNFFFKMTRGHGGRRAYRGKSLTRGVFRQLLQESSLFQEYIPPGIFVDRQGEEWKFDLRAYAYKGSVQQIAGRCYKGRITNFQTGGGYCAVQSL